MKTFNKLILIATVTLNININANQNPPVVHTSKNLIEIGTDDLAVKCNRQYKNCKAYNWNTKKYENANFKDFSKDLQELFIWANDESKADETYYNQKGKK